MRAWIVIYMLLITLSPVLAGAEEAAQVHSKNQTSEKSQEQKKLQSETSHLPVAQIKPEVPVIHEGCIVDAAAIEDIQKARTEIEAKRKELVTQESQLKSERQALDEEFKKLGIAREELTKDQQTLKKENEEKVAKLVETLLTMSPKAASRVLASIDEKLAVATITQMDTPHLAKIMNLMDPGRSTRLSEMTAGVMKSRSMAPEKGGENGQSVKRNTEPAGTNGSSKSAAR